jgi:hypothetical protein
MGGTDLCLVVASMGCQGCLARLGWAADGPCATPNLLPPNGQKLVESKQNRARACIFLEATHPSLAHTCNLQPVQGKTVATREFTTAFKASKKTQFTTN